MRLGTNEPSTVGKVGQAVPDTSNIGRDSSAMIISSENLRLVASCVAETASSRGQLPSGTA